MWKKIEWNKSVKMSSDNRDRDRWTTVGAEAKQSEKLEQRRAMKGNGKRTETEDTKGKSKVASAFN